VIDTDGWEKLTIRRLAAELGIGPTTLYHHVRDKQELLLLLLDEYAGQIPHALPGGTPAERIVAAAVGLHDALADWPWAAEVLTVDGFVGMLGESALGTVEAIVAAAVESGCNQAEAVHLFRNIWYYTVGEILVRAHSARQPPDTGRPSPDAFLAGVDAGRLPHLSSIGAQWTVLAAQDTYRAGVRAITEGTLG
jgi:AcrR family transcriptional regulator